MSFQQFANYVLKQEKKLKLVFRNVDADQHGRANERRQILIDDDV